MLEVRLLGQFDVRVSGRPAVISARPAQTLFAYLVMNGGVTQRREKLAGLLWPDSDEASARHNLRQALWQIRKALGPQNAETYVLADELSVRFNAKSDYRLDVAVLEDATRGICTVDDLVAAVSVYAGELLPGFYDDWVILERERLEALFDRVAGDLLDAYLAEERWTEALDWAQRWIALGHLPEPAYRGLMQAHAALGDVAAAAAAFQRCRKALREQLGVEPSQQTLALYTALTQQRPPTRVSLQHNRVTQVATKPAAPATGQPPAPASGPPPFQGLRYFEEQDADRFFGREALTERLASRLVLGERVLLVVGASGSGKSSLVRAGLIPALLGQKPELPTAFAQEHLLLTPTSHPVQALAAALARDAESLTSVTSLIDDMMADSRCFGLAAQRLMSGVSRNGAGHDPKPQRFLVVVDQFEEVFTLCREENERRAYLANLLTALDDGSPVTLVVALRADFYAHCAAYPRLREVLSVAQEFIGPMNAAELRRTIEGPARLGGWEFESGVVDLILRDTGSEPGALPLLSHALLETWRHRSGRTLTLESYVTSGGVNGALARTAERILRALSPYEQVIARDIFLRLTELGEGAPDTRRRVCLDELTPRPETAPAVQAILEHLTGARLITVHEDTVEVAHEALIREWPTLQAWLATNREGLRLHRRLTEAAAAWADLERDPGELYQGARLAQTADWAAEHAEELNPLEQEFLETSLAWQERKAAELEEIRRRELEAARLVADTQTLAARALRRRALLLSEALALAGVLAVLAVLFARQAENQARFARAREWAAAALGNLAVDPERSVLLALQAVKEARTAGGKALPEAEDALHRAVGATRVRMTLTGHLGPVANLAFSPDGGHLATIGSDGYLKIWDTANGHLVHNVLAHPSGNGFDVAFSYDGALLATSALSDSVRIWDADTAAALHEIKFAPKSYAVEPPALTFIPQSHHLIVSEVDPGAGFYASSAGDAGANIYDAATGSPAENAPALPRANWTVRDLALSPQGTLLANTQYRMTTPDGGPGARVFDLASGRTLLAVTPAWPKTMNSVDLSPDGMRLLVSTNDHKAEIWDIANGKLIQTFSGHTAEVESAVLSPDGKRVATGSLDGTARIWEASTGRELLVLAGHNRGVLAVAFMPRTNGLVLATASADGTARLWDLGPDREWWTFAPPGSASFSGMSLSPDGQWLATAEAQGLTAVWNTSTWMQAFTTTSELDNDFQGLPISRIAFNSDGQRVAVSGLDGVITLRDAHSGSIQVKIESPFLRGVQSLAFSPDGTRLVTVNDARSASVWDTVTGKRIAVMLGHTAATNTVAVSPDGRRVATGSGNGELKLWDMASGKVLRSLDDQGGGIWAVAFSPDGRWLATCRRDGAVTILDAETLEQNRVLLGHLTDVRALAWSPDGSELASGSADTTVKVWDTTSGEELYTLHGHTDLVSELAFSSNGSRLVSASYDGTVRFYLPRLDDLIALARSRVTRTLTTDECRKYLHLSACPAAP